MFERNSQDASWRFFLWSTLSHSLAIRRTQSQAQALLVTTMTRVSLRRSCDACIRAKHRCTPHLPECHRCLQKGLRCSYTNEPLVGKTKACVCENRLETVSTLDDVHRGRCSASSNNAFGIAIVLGVEFLCRKHSTHLHQSLASFPLRRSLGGAANGVHVTLDQGTLTFLVGNIRSVPNLFAQHGKSFFLHSHLYRTHLPAPIEDAFLICVTLSRVTDANSLCFWQTFDSKISTLAQTRLADTCFTLKLAICQALLLYQIISIFHRPLRHCISAADESRRLQMLGHWTTDLLESAPSNFSDRQGNTWDAWIHAESVRRTILASYLVRGVYDVLTLGCSVHTLFVASLPLDTRTWLWEIGQENQWNALSGADGSDLPVLASFREFTDGWHEGRFALCAVFEAMLVAACKGKLAIDLSRTATALEGGQRVMNNCILAL